jgi:uncharacterized protein (DUF427 family)
MTDHPAPAVAAHHSEPAPRRVRGLLGGETVFDTTRALYVWEWPFYPQYFVPLADVRAELLVPERGAASGPLGTSALHGLAVGDVARPHAARVFTQSPIAGVAGTVRWQWDALDAWFEEDEQIFVHPRNPYARVDALRSRRAVRVELDGVVLAQSDATVMVFETGLPTRYYFDPSAVDFARLVASDTVTRCPYKGTTSGYWSVRAGAQVHADLAWRYDFPTREVAPIAGLIAFYNERVDITVDGGALARPSTHFFAADD